MAVRVTADEVGDIIKVDTTTFPTLDQFIRPANLLVTKLCTDSDYSDELLKEIETWLAAHFYAIRVPRRASESVKGVKQNIESKVDLALNVTRYGQMAMTLDTEGNLALASKNAADGKSTQSAGVGWLGTDLYD